MKTKKRFWIVVGVLLSLAAAAEFFLQNHPTRRRANWVEAFTKDYEPSPVAQSIDQPSCTKVLERARELTRLPIEYDPAYYEIEFPNGDVPQTSGVCADIVIRSFREVGWDLQRSVNDDMKKNFGIYPALWSLSQPNTSIDHRRVPNLMTYLKRKATALPLSSKARDYEPCDIVAWDVGGGTTHIGLVSDRIVENERRSIIHHISGRPTEIDGLFAWRVIGHFRISAGNLAQLSADPARP